MKKGYFFVNGKLLDRNTVFKKEEIINLDYKYDYEIYNFGVCKNFDKCKYGALNDVITDTKGNRKIKPNTYIAVLEIALRDSDFRKIDDECFLAEFDILNKIRTSNSKLLYSAMFDEKEKFIENFITFK